MPEDPRLRLQRDLDEAYRRGQLDETVRSVQARMAEISTAIREIQQTMTQLSKGTVTRDEFETLEVKMQELSRWQWIISGGLGVIVAMSQILPRLIDVLRKAPP